MKRHLPHLVLAALGSVLLTACSADRVADPTGDLGENLEVSRANAVTVMTRNMYIGADVDAVIAALASPDPNDDFPTLLNAIGTLQETDFPTRAKALADEILRNRPHAVGLQEVTDLNIDLSGFGIPLTISQDFLASLQAELTIRGLNYIVAGQVTNIQASPIPGISLVDHDALLVDASRVTLGNVKIEQNYTFNIGVVAPGVNILRGFVLADATIGERSYLLADTHLESGSAPGLDQLRAAQAQELAGTIGTAPSVIVLGDFNDTPGSLMYQVMTGAGFTDVWGAVHSHEKNGLTCCHLPNLANESATFDQRIDYVFARGLGRPGDPPRTRVSLTGSTRSDRIAGPLHAIWPSDHAGLVARFVVPPVLVVAQGQ